MIFADQKDILRCTEIIRDELNKKNINVDEKILNKITVDIMNISYSKGGDYSNDIIRSFAETYIEEEFYKKFL
jgi:hypothetical protein